MLKYLQRKFEVRGFYLSRVQPWNGYELIYEIHENYLFLVDGILHIGAHEGQEAQKYANLGKTVIWIEAIPFIAKNLNYNLQKFPNQKAICALLGDENKKEVQFHIASNNAGSSSMFEFGDQAFSSKIQMNEEISLEMKRLDTILGKKDLTKINHWIIDVQGAELLVLQGAGELLDYCNSIFIEISRRNTYINGATWNEILSFLENKGFKPLWNPLIGSHVDVLFIKNQSHM